MRTSSRHIPNAYTSTFEVYFSLYISGAINSGVLNIQVRRPSPVRLARCSMRAGLCSGRSTR